LINGLLRFLTNVVDDNEGEPDDNSIKLAAAALMLEVSRSDPGNQQIELETIASILEARFGFENHQIEALIAAADEKVEAATDLFQFTGLINQHYGYEEKKKLLGAMWVVAFADGHIDAIEDHIIRRIAGLLHLAHEDFIKEKLSARDA
jgi:uncharacterized tellurite resistance protein B-like protein